MYMAGDDDLVGGEVKTLIPTVIGRVAKKHTRFRSVSESVYGIWWGKGVT